MNLRGEQYPQVSGTQRKEGAATFSQFSKGLDDTIALSTISIKQTLCGVELAMQDLPTGEAEEIWGDVGRLLKTALLPPPPPPTECYKGRTCSS